MLFRSIEWLATRGIMLNDITTTGGMSIARDCIRRMQGELNIAADERSDVCFRIELPLSRKNQ